VYGYLLAVFAMFGLAALVIGWEEVGPELGAMLREPVGWIAFGLVGALFGVVLGRAMRG
jgi:hypothetical protein